MNEPEECQHVNRSNLSEGPPDFTPIVDSAGDRVWFCLDCHKASDDEVQA